MVDLCGLSDIPFSGPRFTWGRNGVLSRIDRALVNAQWIQAFPESVVSHIHKIKSDHRPILLCPSAQVYSTISKPFRFLSAWISHPSFNFFVKNKWISDAELPAALEDLSSHLMNWNRNTFGNILKRKKRLLDLLVKADLVVAGNPSEANRREEAEIRSKLELVLWQEEALWVQKSRSNWAVNGDKNTRFFHLATLKRRVINRIKRLKDEDGVWVEDQLSLMELAVRHFEEVYSVPTDVNSKLAGFSNCMSGTDVESLVCHISAEEVQLAVKSMGALKAPGKDGFGPIFFQLCWKVIGGSSVEFIGRCFHTPELIRSINETLITLIPKKQSPESFNYFRPISLCNVAYKTLTKCLAYRIKNLMPGLTHQSQTSFVPGRHITDNILLVQEVVHSLRIRKGKKHSMVIKIYLAKAYDKISWDFVRDTISLVGFPASLVEVFMACISSSSFQVLWNGGCSRSFSSSRGLR
ncbi:Transposon TX1 uncharacterized 149 kDa protein [Linum perenne]